MQVQSAGSYGSAPTNPIIDFFKTGWNGFTGMVDYYYGSNINPAPNGGNDSKGLGYVYSPTRFVESNVNAVGQVTGLGNVGLAAIGVLILLIILGRR